MSESDDKAFTVSDRRLFTANGRLRSDEPEEADAIKESAASEAPRPTAAPRPDATGPGRPVDFASFLLSLGAQASLLLAGQGAREGEDPAEAARAIISILEMLKEKTEGRRTRAEEEVLDSVLFELRMAYLERTRAGTR